MRGASLFMDLIIKLFTLLLLGYDLLLPYYNLNVESHVINAKDITPISQISKGIKCWQCAAKKGGSKCPDNADIHFLPKWNACMTWTLNTGEVILQNFITAEIDCTPERLNFWEKYIDETWGNPGRARCCFSDGCNKANLFNSIDQLLVDDLKISSSSTFDSIDLVPSPVRGCTAVYKVTGDDDNYRNEHWIPTETFTMDQIGLADVYAKVFYAMLSPGEESNDNLIIRLMKDDLDTERLYTIKLYRGAGRAALLGGTRVFGERKPVETLLRSSTIIANIRSNEFTGYWIRIIQGQTIQFGRLNNAEPILEWTANLPYLNRLGFTSGRGGFVQLGCPSSLIPSEQTSSSFKFTNSEFLGIDINTCSDCISIHNSRCVYINSKATCQCKENYIPTFTSDDELNGCEKSTLASYIGDRCGSDIDCITIDNIVCFNYRCVCKIQYTASENKQSCDIREDLNGTLESLDIKPSFGSVSILSEDLSTLTTPSPITTTEEVPSITISIDFEVVEDDEGVIRSSLEVRDDHRCLTDNDCDFAEFGVCLFPANVRQGSCSCLEGYLPKYKFNDNGIPILQRCIDSLNATVTLGGICFMDNHCSKIPNSLCLSTTGTSLKTCQCPVGFTKSGNASNCISLRSSLTSDPASNLLNPDPMTYETCGRITTVIERNEWVPEEIISLDERIFGIANCRIVLFFAKLPKTSNNQDGVIVRLLQNRRTSDELYSIYIRKNGELSIRSGVMSSNGNRAENVEASKTVTRDNWLNENDFMGFWVAIKSGAIAIGVAGEDKLDRPLLNWTDTEAPLDIRTVGLSIVDAAIIYAVQCPNTRSLAAPDVCFSDSECSAYMHTECVLPTSNNTFSFQLCQCIPGHIPIPGPFTNFNVNLSTPLNGCYDPIMSTRTLNGKCLDDIHCKDLPLTNCQKISPNSEERHCTCISGAIPSSPDADTGLIPGCRPSSRFAPSMDSCAVKFRLRRIRNANFIPPNLYRMRYIEDRNMFSSTFFVDFETDDGTLTLTLFDHNLNEFRTAYRATIDYTGSITLSRITSQTGFFFGRSRSTTNVANYVLPRSNFKNGFNGFWIQYELDTNRLSLGLVGDDDSFINWQDEKGRALKDTEFIGYTSSNGSFRMAALCYDV
ncbi:uncharacterized protein [Lepeophtheirus salmonis]